MRLIFLSFILLHLSSNEELKSPKEFNRFDNAYDSKIDNLKKEVFQDYSVGSANWSKNPLGVFKMYIEGTFLDHIFQKRTQNERASLFFHLPSMNHLKQATQNLNAQFLNKISDEKQVHLERPTPIVQPIQSQFTFSFIKLKNEIAKATEALNIATHTKAASAINIQTIKPRIYEFNELFIGSNFWQKDILNSFQIIESIQNLENIFSYTKGDRERDIYLLCTPLRQTLVEKFLLDSSDKPSFDEKCISNVQPPIQSQPCEHLALNIDLVSINSEQKFAEFNHIYSEPIAIQTYQPGELNNLKSYVSQIEDISKQRFNPYINLHIRSGSTNIYDLNYNTNPAIFTTLDPINKKVLINSCNPHEFIQLLKLQNLHQKTLDQQEIISFLPNKASIEKTALLCTPDKNPDVTLVLNPKNMLCKPKELIHETLYLYTVKDEYPILTYRNLYTHRLLYNELEKKSQALSFKRHNTMNSRRYEANFSANNQNHNLFTANDAINTYCLILDHPQSYIDTSPAKTSNIHIKKRDTHLEKSLYANEKIYKEFRHSSRQYLLIACPLMGLSSYTTNAYASNKKYNPHLLINSLSYNINAHYNDSSDTLLSPLYLSDYSQNNILLEQNELNNQLKEYALLDHIFTKLFDHTETIDQLPTTNFTHQTQVKELAPEVYNTNSPKKMQYFDQTNCLTTQNHVDTQEFTFELNYDHQDYDKDLKSIDHQNYPLIKANTLKNISALYKAKNERELFMLLKHNPVNKVISLSNEFSSKVQVIPNMKEDNYIFRIKMESEIKKSPLKHTVYFVIDHSKEIKKSEFYAYKNLINKSLTKLKKQKTFFNIVTIGKDVYKLHTKNLKPTKGSIHLAKQFIEKLHHSNQGDPKRVFDVIQKIKYDSVAKNEMNTVILMSSLKPFKEFAQFKQPLKKITQINSNNFQLFSFYYGPKNAASGINLLAKLNRGYLISSSNANILYKKATTLMTKIKRPFITNIRLTLANPEQKNVNFSYCSDYNPIIHAQKPFYIYGKINTLDNIKFILQGRQGHEWINIVQNIDFMEAKIAKGSLEKRLASENSLFWYAKYFQEPHPRYLKIAKEKQKPFDLALP